MFLPPKSFSVGCLFISNPSNLLPLFCLQMQSLMLGCRGQQAHFILGSTSGMLCQFWAAPYQATSISGSASTFEFLLAIPTLLSPQESGTVRAEDTPQHTQTTTPFRKPCLFRALVQSFGGERAFIRFNHDWGARGFLGRWA